ncbi:hypothetical protein LN650_19805 [Klebsiella pneumoniae subsp. pneumoniae]|nr:hypothetical protein [Klebsiella pneumoniae subsp. pneumoniae]
MRNVTAAQKVQDTADATAAAVDSLTTTVTQQGNLLTLDRQPDNPAGKRAGNPPMPQWPKG